MSLYQKKEKQGQFVSMGRQGGNIALKQMKRFSYQKELEAVRQQQQQQALDDARTAQRNQIRMAAGTAASMAASGASAAGPVGAAVGGIIGGAYLAGTYYANTGNYKPFLFPGAEFIPGWGSFSNTAIEDVFGGLF